MFNRPHTAETKLKISLKIKGVPKTTIHRERIRLTKLGSKNPQWRGDDVGDKALHEFIRRHLTKPELCQGCNKVPPYDLANKSGKYLRDLTDWEWLCRSCHMLSDGRMNNLRQYQR